MKSRTRPLAALLLLFVAFASTASVCAGWQESAEARMACCQDEANCPMHATGRRGPTLRVGVSQFDADRCCASAERGTSTPSTASFVTNAASAVLANPIPAIGPQVVVFRESASARTSIDVRPAPTHLLLSVFLI